MTTEIILLGHGSRRKEANDSLIEVAKKVEDILGHEVTPAFMGNWEPRLPEAVKAKVEAGAQKIIIMPLFLFRGMHVTVDIRNEVQEIQETHPEVEIVFTPELGADDSIAILASSRIKEALRV
ncbi:sirohydrochlorin chelatase [Desulfitobacterium metallireducens]|uniref:Cobalamin biosynthesis protein CbiX n=1 Tax=Desulfitobacterium metallireducens DSM 15288 TaxID=871968 RepID=W0EAR5_9FIRM|nr:CbiX/SirB N-terminal domain-containing protein [Desulfitobacterium metallireducens]AHF06299.1 cobalamin biosynthesis protein CbiX [Desulfitobacterium metallireducens DSM 15288]